MSGRESGVKTEDALAGSQGFHTDSNDIATGALGDEAHHR